MPIKELKQILEAATPGPWRVAGPSGFVENSSSDVATICQFWSRYELDYDNWQANARLIVEAVNNLPKLLKVAEAAEEAVIAEDAGFEAVNNGGDLTLAAERMSDAVEALRKALEELNDE